MLPMILKKRLPQSVGVLLLTPFLLLVSLLATIGSPLIRDMPDAPVHFASNLSVEDKNTVFRHLLSTLQPNVSYHSLVTVASEHNIKRVRRDLLLTSFQSHLCSWTCFVRQEDVFSAGVALTTDDFARPRDRHTPDASTVPPPLSRPPTKDHDPSETRQRNRTLEKEKAVQEDDADKQYWAKNWPQVETPELLKDVRIVSFIRR